MSGVQVGSRLEQLRALRRRLDHEIATEERRIALDVPARPAPRPPRPTEVNRVDVRLRELGVTAREVKEWAYDAGLILEIKRGRVSEALVEHFADARERLNDLVRSQP